MSRRELREQMFKLVFRAEFNSMDEMPEQVKLFFEDDETQIRENDITYISEKSNKIMNSIGELDNLINEKAKGWTTERMSKVDLTILRLAVFEIKFDEEILIYTNSASN